MRTELVPVVVELGSDMLLFCVQEERSQVLWQALERFIPDIRQRTELCMVGQPADSRAVPKAPQRHLRPGHQRCRRLLPRASDRHPRTLQVWQKRFCFVQSVST